MGLVYVDIREMEDIFRSYDLNDANILEFMASDEMDDKYKRMLKLYLCSLLESYVHIDYLRLLFCLVYKKNFDKGAEFGDIISLDSDCTFWNCVLNGKGNFDSSALLLWMGMYFTEYYEYFFSDSKDCSVEDGKRKAYVVDKFVQCVGAELSVNDFNNFIKFVISYFQDNKFDVPADEVADEIKYLCEDIFLNDYVAKLRSDLVFNYNMLLSLFSDALVSSSSLSSILTLIRRLFHCNAKKFLDCSREELIDLGDDYRDFSCCGDNSFWESTPNFEDISDLMQKLFDKFDEIDDDKDDVSYMKKMFRLSQNLLKIHPYRNGNGRTSKYLLFVLALRRNLLPITVTDGNYLPECYSDMQDRVDNYFQYRISVASRRFK